MCFTVYVNQWGSWRNKIRKQLTSKQEERERERERERGI